MTTWTIQRLAATLLAASLIGAGVPACGDDSDDEGTPDGGDNDSGGSGSGGGGHGGSHADSGGSDDDGGIAAEIDSPAANLRVSVNLLLGEHLILAAKATGAALGDRGEEFAEYQKLLNKNGTDIGAAIKAAFDAKSEEDFNRIWSAHNGYFVAYTQGVAADDSDKSDQAVEDLTTKYVPEFTTFLNKATGLPEATLEELITDHVLQTKKIVDDQKAEKWADVYADIKAAFQHMAMIGDPLSGAIADKQATKFPGDGATKPVDFRTALNQLFQAHLYYATLTTDAALGARTGEGAEALKALNANGKAIGTVLGQLYDADAEEDFNRIWSAHNGYFVAYTTGVAMKSEAMKTAAVDDLTDKYVPEFTSFLHEATDLPEATLEKLIGEHVEHTKAVVDAQGKDPRDEAKVASEDRAAAQHMQMLADPLATAIVEKVPTKF